LAAVFGLGPRFVTPAQVVQALGVDPEAAAKKLSRWAQQGWLRRARRGLYIPVPVDVTDPSAWSEDALLVATAVWSPCYFTGWTAANHWALTDQVFRTTVMKTTGRVRSTSVRLLDHEYLVSHTPPRDIEWGMRTEWRQEIRVRFADPARTVVDILDAPRLGGGIRHCAEVVASYLDDDNNDPGRLIEYGDRLGNRTVFKRLGHIVETSCENHVDLIDACRSRVSAGISALDPDGPADGRRSMRWGLRLNVELGPEEPA
jgi:predicted transcriptional regulator of viral defense system